MEKKKSLLSIYIQKARFIALSLVNYQKGMS